MNEYGYGSSRRRTGDKDFSRRNDWDSDRGSRAAYDSDWEGDRRGSSEYDDDWDDEPNRAGGSFQSGVRSRAGSDRSDNYSRSTAAASGRGAAGRRNSSGSGSRRDFDRRSTSSSGRGGGHGGKKPNFDITKILMYVIGVVILVLVIVMVVKGCGLFSGKADSAAVTESSSTQAASQAQTTVDGIAIDGLTQAEAKDAIMNQYGWQMKVAYQGKEAPIKNLMEEKVDMLLEQIYAGDQKGAFVVDTSNMMDAAKGEAALLSGKWNLVPKNGGITGYDKKTDKFTFEEGTNGAVIDQDKLAQDIVNAIQKKDYKAVIQAQTKEVSPDLSIAQLKDKYTTISTFTTKTTDNSNRNENIRLSCDAINGTIVNPGQEFSFNNTTGARTEAKGYKPATAYLYGEIVQEPGGGVCQISSTLYNAVIFAGLKSTERHAHSYEPSYVTPGEDAAVSFGGPDFKFVNNSDYPIAIRTKFANKQLTISIYGVPILKKGEKIRMSSEKKQVLDPPPPIYEEDQTLQLDEEKTVKEAVPGSSWSTDLVTYQDGKEVSREFFHNSSYRGKSQIIKRNTSGVVITTEASTESAPASTEVLIPSTDYAGQTSGPADQGPGSGVNPPAGGGPLSPAGQDTGNTPGTPPPGAQNPQGPAGPAEQGPGH